MIDSKFRSPFQNLLIDPVIPYARRLSPSTVTITGCVLGIAAALWVGLGLKWLGALFLILSGYLDVIDGSLARFKNMDSPSGAALDITCDRIVEAAIVIGLCALDAATRAMPSLFMLASILICITTFLVVGIFTEKEGMKSFNYGTGLMERTEAFLFFLVMILVPSLFTILAYLFAVLVFYTGIHRVVQFRAFSKEQEVVN